MRRRIYLVRHGEVDYYTDEAVRRSPDKATLTATGREQARATGAALQHVVFDRVATSGLDRTIETARIVLEKATAPSAEQYEAWPQLTEIRTGSLSAVPRTTRRQLPGHRSRRRPPPRELPERRARGRLP